MSHSLHRALQEHQFCRSCGAGIGYYRNPGEGTCPRCSLRILVVCEASGTIRDEACEQGHDAWSIDLLGYKRLPPGFTLEEWEAIWNKQKYPSRHIQGDALELLNDHGGKPWDIIIAHPPCTYLTNSGVRWLYEKGTLIPVRDRWRSLNDGASFFNEVSRLARYARIGSVLENPIMHKYAMSRVADSQWRTRKVVQPYQFGTPETKATVLWLDRLDPLVPHNPIPRSEAKGRVHKEPPRENRWWYRSLTDKQIAYHMVRQWGALGHK